jgi:hypothetical protein
MLATTEERWRCWCALVASETEPVARQMAVVDSLSDCYHFLNDYKAALPHAQRGLVLAKQLFGARSKEHAQSLKRRLCMVRGGLKAFPKARKAIGEALAIMEELGLQQDEEYGSMLVAWTLSKGGARKRWRCTTRPRPC